MLNEKKNVKKRKIIMNHYDWTMHEILILLIEEKIMTRLKIIKTKYVFAAWNKNNYDDTFFKIPQYHLKSFFTLQR